MKSTDSTSDFIQKTNYSCDAANRTDFSIYLIAVISSAEILLNGFTHFRLAYLSEVSQPRHFYSEKTHRKRKINRNEFVPIYSIDQLICAHSKTTLFEAHPLNVEKNEFAYDRVCVFFFKQIRFYLKLIIIIIYLFFTYL